MELKATRVSLGGLIHEIVETLRPIAAEKLIQLEAITSEPSNLVSADRERVTQVLMNLLGNALKFSARMLGMHKTHLLNLIKSLPIE